MKKIFALVLAIAMVATFAACGEPATAEYKLGMGISVSLDSSADATAEKNATAQADATVATVVMDADGKIVAADLDCAQTKVQVKDGKIVDIDKVDLRTKKEKKEDYAMKGASPIGKEWYEQAAAFVEKMIGKTVADIEAIATEEKNGHQVATDADLYAACTMDITAFKAAFIAACKDDQAKTFTAAEGFKLGLDVETNVAGSTDAGEKNATAQLYSTFGAIVVDADGKTIAAIVDEIQPKVEVDNAGKIAAKTFVNTKRSLKEDYNMVKFSPEGTCIAEWYVQAADLTDYIAEKAMTADEIKAIATADTRNDGYMRPTDADLAAKCTMQIAGYQAVLANAIGVAK
ncbi:MAG: hypothetical protein E7540_02475 [Ruminococcaceae bacterium]|nr:hypothetical protein [Oscillospiraceae bacterium]